MAVAATVDVAAPDIDPYADGDQPADPYPAATVHTEADADVATRPEHHVARAAALIHVPARRFAG
ncbi:hypothetical protein [Luteipulveratus mongoliensis]|uniref:hypothetical protein n=1 Tax=Luteipulveratus mongoliensis TaxID=571913 RepID=UPI0012EE9FFA|nr:hypothetical protein [Luteipulveratus mongoliensis]